MTLYKIHVERERDFVETRSVPKTVYNKGNQNQIEIVANDRKAKIKRFLLGMENDALF